MKINAQALAALPFYLQAEISENMFRKELTPSEVDNMRRSVEAVLRAQAKQRQREHNGTAPGKKHLGKIAPSEGRAPKVSEQIAAFVGSSGRTVEKIAAICDAANADPETFGPIKEQMDKRGLVDAPYRRMRVLQQAAEIRAQPPVLPNKGPYRCIVCDPPWPYEIRSEDPSNCATYDYPQMSIKEICAVDLASIAHEDSILWLWTTNCHMVQAFEVLDAWGFQQKTILTWAKDRVGCGRWLRGQTEHCLMCTRGRPIVHLTNQTTLLHGKARAHSQKPVEFYSFVEALCPAPAYAYLFSRYQHNAKWHCHGNAAPADVAQPAA